MSDQVYIKTVNAMRFIRVLIENQVPEFMQFLGDDWQHRQVWEILRMMCKTVELDLFMPEWQKRNGIMKITMQDGEYNAEYQDGRSIAEYQVRIHFESQSAYAMFTLAHGKLPLDY